MVVLVFEVRGKLAHFRRPDTTVTHATYPFITRTALLGMLASILGKPALEGRHLTGIELMAPVATVAQEMSMLGKGWFGQTDSFNRPTSIELVVDPHYRVYYAGEEAVRLAEMIGAGRSVYHTYLGSAYCLTFPQNARVRDYPVVEHPDGVLTCQTVVPSHVVQRLVVDDGARYERAGGMQYECVDVQERRFSGIVNVLFEATGRPLRFVPVHDPAEPRPVFVRVDHGMVAALW